MIRYPDALAILEKIATQHSLPVETVKLHESLGRILAEEVRSPEAVPSFTNSSMDGFAVFASDTKSASETSPARIPVKGMVAAGDLKAFQTFANQGPGIAVEIMTGAPVPAGGLDAIVRIEDARVERNDDGTAVAISISKPSLAGDYIRPIGTDYQVGQLVLRAGIRLEAEHILAASSLGVRELSVKKMPKIAIISTGSELVSPDAASLAPGMIRNSTGPFLVAALKRMGVIAKDWGIIQDDPKEYQKILETALSEGTEIILSTGAVSMGQFDFVSDVLHKMEATTHFHKVAIRPGKPILFAEFGSHGKNAVFFGIPGNPVSTAVGLRFFVEPYLRQCLGLPPEKPLRIPLSQTVSKPEGMRCFFKGRIQIGDQGRTEVEALKGQASYIVSALVEANAWVVLPEAGEQVGAGTEVDVYRRINHD